MTNQTTTTVTLQDMIDLLPQRVELIYVDYRDNLDDRMEDLQKCINQQDYSPIDDVTDEWFWESQAESIDYLLKELRSDLLREYEWDSENDVDSLIEDNRESLEEVLYNRDSSHPLSDLLRNTSDMVCFYDTGYRIDSESWTWNTKEMRSWREKVKRVMRIPTKNHTYDKRLELMLGQSSYGGRLVVYFKLDSRDFEKFVNLSEYNTIQFTNPMIAVIDTFHGSGDHTDLPGHTCNFKLDKDNIVLDKTIKYNYTYAVCDMLSNWCDCTDYVLSMNNSIRAIRKSSIADEKSVESGYEATYKAGGCTAGDMDLRRHRHTYYDNTFPCGTHCKDCGTFWID